MNLALPDVAYDKYFATSCDRTISVIRSSDGDSDNAKASVWDQHSTNREPRRAIAVRGSSCAPSLRDINALFV